MGTKFVVCLLFFRRATIEHAGESWVQLSVGVEIEAYGDQAAAASHLFCCKSREEPCRKPCDPNIEWYNYQGQTEVTWLFAITFQDLSEPHPFCLQYNTKVLTGVVWATPILLTI